MKRFSIIAAALALSALGPVDSAEAIGPWGCRHADSPWHAGYYHAAWGTPVALVVPPTAEYQTHWGWGVGNYRITPIRPQFKRNWPGPGQYDPQGFKPTPPWPSDTDQFGVYYVRGPWNKHR